MNSTSQASSDLFGSGVRVGFYLQGWSFLANCFFSNIADIPSQLLPTGIISFTFLLSTVILRYHHGIGDNEILVTVGLVQTAIFPALYVMNIAEARSNGIAIMLILIDILFAEGLFLYLTAYRSQIELGNFVFGFIAVFLSMGLFFKPVLCWWRLTVRLFQGKPEPNSPETNLWTIFKSKAKKEELDQKLPMLSTSWILPILAVAYMIIETLLVERAIRLRGLHPNNQIQQPGQLIPFFTGILSCFDSMVRILKVNIRKRRGYPVNTSVDELPISAKKSGSGTKLIRQENAMQENKTSPPSNTQPAMGVPQPNGATYEGYHDQSASAWRV